MRRYRHLSAEERDGIAEMHARHEGVSAIAAAIGRNKSTVSREIARNGRNGRYGAIAAQSRSDARRKACRPRKRHLRPGPRGRGAQAHRRRPPVARADRRQVPPRARRALRRELLHHLPCRERRRARPAAGGPGRGGAGAPPAQGQAPQARARGCARQGQGGPRGLRAPARGRRTARAASMKASTPSDPMTCVKISDTELRGIMLP